MPDRGLANVTRIEDYAFLSDCRGSALVSRAGSVDWLCVPRFDSGAACAALLGTPEHGRWLLAPHGETRATRRRYIPGTLVLETEWQVAGGAVRIVDFMTPDSEAPTLVRIAECLRGEVLLDCELRLCFDYGSIVPWLLKLENGVRITAGPDSMYLRSDTPLKNEGSVIRSQFTLRAGEQARFELAWAATEVAAPDAVDLATALQDAIGWWQEWSSRCTYRGPWQDDVRASLITLKGLTYAPTGGIVAAPTTSLPEHLGGQRNWDYRYCWLRDATFTLYAFLIGGYVEEARAWRQWLIHAVAGKPSQMQIMYGVAGERRLTEIELDWLPGYENSLPVRVGNAAYSQHQLDVPGEVMEALHLARRQGLAPTEEAWRVQQAIMSFLEKVWQDPDEGIWEVRGPRRHFTHSKVMAWVAADRAAKDVDQYGLPGDAERWQRLADDIHRQVCAEGFNDDLGAFVQYYGGQEPDASLLVLPLVGFIEPRDPRMLGTLRLIEQRLVRDGFVDRYCTDSHVDGLPPGEGAFLLCSFWLADNLALVGRDREARQMFERLLALRNDVGLLAEEYHPGEKRLLGNFPQAFSHIGLVNTANILAKHVCPTDAPQQVLIQ
jgi:GH15 family glucan-1,4-alpha-glucosidase